MRQVPCILGPCSNDPSVFFYNLPYLDHLSLKSWMLILVLLCENERQRWDASRYIKARRKKDPKVELLETCFVIEDFGSNSRFPGDTTSVNCKVKIASYMYKGSSRFNDREFSFLRIWWRPNCKLTNGKSSSNETSCIPGLLYFLEPWLRRFLLVL